MLNLCCLLTIIVENSFKIFFNYSDTSSQAFFGFKPQAMSTQPGEDNFLTNESSKGEEVNVTDAVIAGPSRIFWQLDFNFIFIKK